jgi:HKD family nuclease
METQIIDNEKANLRELLQSTLEKAVELNVSVAFLKNSGLSLLKSGIINMLKNKANAEFLIGLDFRTTDPESLFELKKLKESYANLKFFCFCEPNENPFSIFHPKLYLIKSRTGVVTSIVGSSNLTKGGLSDNVELNVVFKGKDTESEILQLTNFYLRMRLKESVFEPSLEYIEGYQKVYRTFISHHDKAFRINDTKKEIAKLKEIEEALPGTRPTIRRLIINAIKNLRQSKENYVHLQDIYAYVKEQLTYYGVDFSSVVNIDANIRRAIYGDMIGWKGQYNQGYFEREATYSGLFRLTQKGENFNGR